MLSSNVWRAGLTAAAARGLLGRLLNLALLIALVGLTALLAVAVAPRVMGYATLTLHGGSMGQAYPNGSLVVARWLEAAEVQPGDVILVQEEGPEGASAPKLHRVVTIERRDGQVIAQTKGDANDSADPTPYTLPARVLTPVFHLPYAGLLIGFVRTPLGWALLLALPASALAIVTLRRIWLVQPQAAPGRRLPQPPQAAAAAENAPVSSPEEQQAIPEPYRRSLDHQVSDWLAAGHALRRQIQDRRQSHLRAAQALADIDAKIEHALSEFQTAKCPLDDHLSADRDRGGAARNKP